MEMGLEMDEEEVEEEVEIPHLMMSGDWRERRQQSRWSQPWLREVGVVERRPVRTSCDVMSRRSNRPQHHEALYFPHRRLWITEYSCKVWYKPCKCRLIPRQHSRHNWRPRLRHQLRTMVDLPSWSDSRG
ncbi:hypothetical protein Taro_040089 [Colocasia esculenta]|uniref:Uncharacterized protein n=1 Tax=Colocasia esculenta TaxID=4460 RepID=A0A843WP74_COLES|nr:hypothetical protein [Colocasia esculenta]